MPTASMRANIVVGPTKAKPLRLSAFESASDSGEVVGTSASVRGRGVTAGRNDQTNRARSPSGSSRRASVARALVTVASTLARLRTMPASAISRATSASP